MKRKSDIQKLEEQIAKGDALPVRNEGFAELRHTLREIVHDNIGYSEAKSLEYDYTTQTFYFEVSKRTVVGTHYGTFTTTVVLDPAKGLLRQLEEAQETVKTIKDECFAAENRFEKSKEGKP